MTPLVKSAPTHRLGPTYLTYFTRGSDYRLEATKLVASLRQFNLPYEVRAIPDLGNWEKNTRFKALFLYEFLLHCGAGQKSVFLDADAVIKRAPELLSHLSCDVAAHVRERNGRPELLSGTIYLERNMRTLATLQLWHLRNRTQPNVLEQENLLWAIKVSPWIRFKLLPPEYAFIFDITRAEYPELEPVIEHFQASRRLRGNEKTKVNRNN